MIPRFKPDLGSAEIKALFRRNAGAVEKFEKEFAKAFHAVDAIAFPYGRSAQWAFFNAMEIKDAEIIMPAYTCSVVAHAVSLSGNTPRFIDIKLDDYNMDLDLVESAVNERTRAIIATHTFGYPQDLDRLAAIVRDAETTYGHKIWLMQDCCHAFGAEWKGRMIGTSGDVAVYAFNISKMITSIFGGMLTFQDQELANKVRMWRDQHYREPHWTKAILRRLYLFAVYFAFNPKVYGFTWWLQEKTPFLHKFTKAYHLDNKIHFPPDAFDKMLPVEAMVGLVQLKKYPRIIQRRREMAKSYDKNLPRPESSVFPPLVEGATYSHYPIRVKDKSKIINKFSRNSIQLGELIQYSLPDIEEYKNLGIVAPNSLLASKCLVNLPISNFSNKVKRKIIAIGLSEEMF